MVVRVALAHITVICEWLWFVRAQIRLIIIIFLNNFVQLKRTRATIGLWGFSWALFTDKIRIVASA